MTLIVVRHGRTEANAAGRLLGQRLDPGLDELGVQQASAVAAAVRPLAGDGARVVSSPLRRARETAEALAGELGAAIDVDDRWIELDYGELDGVPLSDVPPAMWDRWRRDPAFVPPGGESLRALGDRVRAACAEINGAATHGAASTVVVTHVSPVKAAVAWALGIGDEVAWRLFVAPAAITVVRTGTVPSLRSFNATAHLDGLEVSDEGRESGRS